VPLPDPDPRLNRLECKGKPCSPGHQHETERSASHLHETSERRS
jgi:hypothetical protein